MKANAMKKPTSTKASAVNTDKAATKAGKRSKVNAAELIATAAIECATAAGNAWATMLAKTRGHLTALTLEECESVIGKAKKAAKKEMGKKVNGSVLQYISDAWSVIRAERIAADPAKVRTKAAKAAAAAFTQAVKSGSGKATKTAARELLKVAGIIKGKDPRQPQAPATFATLATPTKDISPEARDYVRTLRAALVGVTLNKAANDALRGLALLLKIDAPDAE